MSNEQNHEKFMRECFRLAKKSIGQTSPNPYVGSVIVKDNKIIARGYHERSGLPHAEANAIRSTDQELEGATLYCNLEPCSHLDKKTPPCAQAILKTGITKVVIANLDPNPKVSGNGVKLLQENNIEVITGILKEEGELLNEVFFTHIQKKRPFIHLKWAQTLDGKAATLSYDSKWITNEKSRNYAHKERNLYDAIVIGATTANTDNPRLSIRLNSEEICKKRIILRSRTQLNPDLSILNDHFKEKTQVIDVSHGLDSVMDDLYDSGIHSIYVEGGLKTISHFIKAKLFDRVSVFIAPKILGSGLSLEGNHAEMIKDAVSFETGHWQKIEQDMLFESERNICLQD